MGEVYRAVDARLDRIVAIKVLPEAFANDPERLQRFEHEARLGGHYIYFMRSGVLTKAD